MSRPEFSVVVPVRDGAEGLGLLLESLRGQTFPSERFEVIVVDNGSRDRSAVVAEAWGARVVEVPKPSRAAARNAGVAAAEGSLIAFTDADCVASPGWLEAFGNRTGSAQLLAGKVAVTISKPANRIERFESLWRFEQEAWALNLGWAATANLMVEREAFDAVGGFDPAYRHIGEDVDFCIRAGREGFAIGFCPGAEVHHAGESRQWPMLKRSFWHGYGTAQVRHRVGSGYRAWTSPGPLLDSSRAAALIGINPDRVNEGDWDTMRRLARRAYAMRMAGSLWADLHPSL